MANKQAKTLDEAQVQTALAAISASSSFPARDRAMLLLSFRIGLRAQEIARLHVEDFTDAEGRLATQLFVAERGAKYGKNRYLPLNRQDLKEALAECLRICGKRTGPLFRNQYNKEMSPSAVQQQLTAILREKCGFIGTSSHSGRRSFGTRFGQQMHKVGASIEDLQHFMGHANVSTTVMYIDRSANAGRLLEVL